MKNILPWIKSNVAIVVLSAVILLIIPAAFVGSSMWNARIKKNREKAVSTAMSQLDSSTVTYTAPPAVPGGNPITFKWAAPNKAATEFFRENRTKIEEQIKRITVEAEAINKGGHAPLLEGVFPTPTGPTKTVEFTELLVGKGDTPSAYQKLLNDIKAGGPADPARVAEILNEAERSAREALQASKSTDKFTPEELKEHAERLVKLRLGQYKAHAATISVYATTECLPKDVLRSIPSEPPPVTACWTWQEDYWAIADLLNAVKEANLIDGKLTGDGRSGVDRSVVKRVEQIALFQRDSMGDTITGRKGGPTNTVYDVRPASMTVIVSSARLPQFINAISRTNFMSVIDVDFTEVDTHRDLAQGYYYGDEHVVRATVTLESIWLKSWTTALMPEEEKKRREATGEEAAAAAAPMPAASPRAARGNIDDDSSSRPKPAARGKGNSTKRPGAKKGGE